MNPLPNGCVMPRPGAYVHHSYKPPSKDSARALAGCRTFLATVESLDAITVVRLMNRYNLTPRVAERELSDAKARRRA